MTSVFVIVRKNWRNASHGVSCQVVEMVLIDPFDVNSSHPAFTTKEKADAYIVTLPEYQAVGLTPYEIFIKE